MPEQPQTTEDITGFFSASISQYRNTWIGGEGAGGDFFFAPHHWCGTGQAGGYAKDYSGGRGIWTEDPEFPPVSPPDPVMTFPQPSALVVGNLAAAEAINSCTIDGNDIRASFLFPARIASGTLHIGLLYGLVVGWGARTLRLKNAASVCLTGKEQNGPPIPGGSTGCSYAGLTLNNIETENLGQAVLSHVGLQHWQAGVYSAWQGGDLVIEPGSELIIEDQFFAWYGGNIIGGGTIKLRNGAVLIITHDAGTLGCNIEVGTSDSFGAVAIHGKNGNVTVNGNTLTVGAKGLIVFGQTENDAESGGLHGICHITNGGLVHTTPGKQASLHGSIENVDEGRLIIYAGSDATLSNPFMPPQPPPPPPPMPPPPMP